MEFTLATPEATSLLEALRSGFPQFMLFLEQEKPVNVQDDGTLSAAGLWVEFCWWLNDHAGEIDESKLEALGRYVSRCHAADNREISGPVTTSFLENIACLPVAAQLRKYLSPEAGQFMDKWQ